MSSINPHQQHDDDSTADGATEMSTEVVYQAMPVHHERSSGGSSSSGGGTRQRFEPKIAATPLDTATLKAAAASNIPVATAEISPDRKQQPLLVDGGGDDDDDDDDQRRSNSFQSASAADGTTPSGVLSPCMFSGGLAIDDDAILPEKSGGSDDKEKYDVSTHGRSAAVALVLYILSFITFAVIGGIHGGCPNCTGWSPALFSMPVVLLIAAVVYTQGCRWRTLTINKIDKTLHLSEFGTACFVFPSCGSSTIGFDVVSSVAIVATQESGLGGANGVYLDAIELQYRDKYHEPTALPLTLCQGFESRRRAAGWLVVLTNAGMNIEFSKRSVAQMTQV